MNWLEFVFIVITGFTASAEFGSFAFVHPVVKRLPQNTTLWWRRGWLVLSVYLCRLR